MIPWNMRNADGAESVRVGVLETGIGANPVWLPQLVPALRELGWVEGRNLTLESRFAEGRRAELPKLTSELIQLGVQVIVGDHYAIKGAQAVTRTMPLVVTNALTPVQAGFAKSLARPGGNITGVQWGDPTFSAKSMQILKETLPGIQRVGALYASQAPEEAPYRDAAKAAAKALGISFHAFLVGNQEDLEAALATAKDLKIDAFRIGGSGYLALAEARIISFSVANKIPTSYTGSGAVKRGAFMSYSPHLAEMVSRVAALVDKILKGAKPADLPFEYSTRYELVINLKAAKQLGITVPQAVLQRADRVIE
jgi:putative ABC transport system substrate-binding protein